jgi:hypothetical protein
MASDLPTSPVYGRQLPLSQGSSGPNIHGSHPSYESHPPHGTDATNGTYETPSRRRKHGATIWTLLLFLLTLSLTAAAAQPASQEWQLKAVQKYPELGVQGSALNQRFIAEYNKRLAANPSFFNDPQWPLLLADELAASTPAPTPTATPAPSRVRPKSPAGKASPATFRDRWNAVSQANQILALLAAALVAAAACHAVARTITLRLKWTRIRTKADAYLSQLEGSDGIPTVPTHLALHTDERAFYCAASSLHEPRDTRYQQPSPGGFQLARGVWIAGSPDRSVTQRTWEKLDSGMITVTNQRVVFDGRSESVIIPIKRLDSVQAMGDSVELRITGRKKNMVFEAANPLILASIIHLSQGGHDARLRGAYIRDHPAAASRSSGNTTSHGNQSWHASSPPPPPPRDAERPDSARRETAPEPEYILHARTLGLSGSFEFADVKKNYYERMKEYHPDRVSGLGPKLRELAEIESKKINAAYEFFTKTFRATREA